MLHAVARSWLVVAFVACGDQASAPELLSASRLALGERETARVHVRVARVEDFQVDAPSSITITPITDAFGPAFDVTPTCGAASGADANLVIRVHDRGSDRTGALVVAVTDDPTDACAAAIAMWLEPCVDTACAQPCGAAPSTAQPLTLVRGDSARLCVQAGALDPARPLADEQLAIEPATSAFEAGPVVGTTRSIAIHGAHWLVGPYRAIYTATAGSVAVARNLPLEIGALDDVGIEIGNTAVVAPPAEFARTVVAITVHRFPQAMRSCAIQVRQPVANAIPCNVPEARLYDADAVGYAACQTADCSLAAHPNFTLAYVPGIDSLASIRIPIMVSTPTTETADVILDIASRAEDLICASASRVACADLDGNGVLEVVGDSGSNTCVHSLTLWRQADASFASPAPTRIFAVGTAGAPQILGITAGAVSRFAPGPGPLPWQWAAAGFSVPDDAVPIRSGASGAPDYLVGLVPGTASLRFVSLAGIVAGSAVLPGLPSGPYSIGVVDIVGGGQDLALVGGNSASPSGQPFYVYTIDWTNVGPGKPPSLTAYAQGNVANMPNGAIASIASRARAGSNDDLLISFYAGPFASGVAAFAVQPGTLGPPLVAYGSVRSLAAAPDGSVLLGDAGGAQRTWIDATSLATEYADLDPVPQLTPDAAYGNTIVPCLGAGNTIAGYVVQTSSTSATTLRAAQLGIVPATP